MGNTSDTDKPVLKKTTSWTTDGSKNDVASNINPPVNRLDRSRNLVLGLTKRRAIKEKGITINQDEFKTNRGNNQRHQFGDMHIAAPVSIVRFYAKITKCA